MADEDRQLSAKELENMFLRKTAEKWDSKASDATLKEIDESTLKEFIKRANNAERVKFSYNNKRSVLEKLNLMKDSKPTNAARILFSASKPIEVQAAIFAGTDKTTFLDIQQFKGNLFRMLVLSENYIKEHINWRAKLIERERKEIPEVPVRAITEALVNSFCHRDYIAPESNKIAIYKDRIEIWNPGDFPEGYKPQDFIRKELPSILRNPLIANILYLSADIEKWGSGLRRISKDCRANKVKTEFKVMNYGFAVEFKRPRNSITPKTTPKIKRWYEKWYERWYEKGFSKREIWIISQIDNNPNISIQKLSEEAGINPSAIQKHIDKLKIKKVLIRYGSAKGGYWKINKAIIVSP
ncbi:MAG: ATP-binding protein [Nanoarchaeota archaeon]